MERTFPDCISFTRPQGGLFAWVILPEYINARKLPEKNLEGNIAFVPGDHFFQTVVMRTRSGLIIQICLKTE
jgi:2-aminoadipate transaminase